MLHSIPQAAAPDGATLVESLALAGPDVQASGADPLRLDDPDLAILVVSGGLDVFLVEAGADQPAGPRNFLASFGAGRLVFGLGDGAMGAIGLRAVPAPGSRLVALPLACLRDLSRDPPSRPGDLAGAGPFIEASTLIEDWVAAVSAALVSGGPPPPAVRLPLAPGERADCAADARVTVAAPVGWLDVRDREALFLDSADVPGDGLFPVCPQTWLTLGTAGEVACLDTASALRDGRLWTALAQFHAAAAEVLPLLLRLAAVDEINRLRRRTEDEARAVAKARAILAAVVVKLPPPRQIESESGDDLMAALRHVARAMGIALVLPQDGDEAGPPDLEAVLRASNLRSRRINLDFGWWRDDVAPLLLLEGPDGRPAALVGRGRGVALVGPDGRRRRLGARAAQRLTGPALMLYEPLPDRPLDLPALLRRVWAGGRRELRIVAAFGALPGLLALVFPIMIGHVADDLVPSRDLPGLIEAMAILVVVTMLQLVMRLTSGRAMMRLDGSTGSRLQAALMDRVLRLPANFFRTSATGEIAQKISSLKGTVDGTVQGLLATLVGASIFASSVAVMAWTSPTLMGAGLVLVGILVGTATALGLKRKTYEKDLVRNRARLSAHVLDLMSGIVKLRLAAAENRAFARWAAVYAPFVQVADAAKRVDLRVGLVLGAMSLSAQAIIFLLIYRSGAVEAGFGLGALVMFLSAFGQAVGGANAMAGGIVSVLALKPALDSASVLLVATPERSSGAVDPGPLTGAIEIGNVRFAYGASAPPVLTDLSLQIAAGEFVALVGPSGGGKSTIVRLLLGFEVPQRGAILYDSQDLRSLDVGAVRRQLGVVLQRGKLFGASIEDNILASNRQLGPDEAWRAAEEAGIADDIRAMPMGMQTVYSEGGLSGGQVQRILLARALIHRPRILILDEATSALDNRTQAQVTATLATLSATRIVIAHRLSTVMSADRILVIEDGAVVESGSYRELLEAGGAFAAIAARQLT
ncbi:ATP-binding cassette domain-containing protein [Methylobacterium aquaticum]|uniref:ATP-binding cassette domain-containing protein n=1 Tax=Methylobacterium aquaticum TaxID=270351 RepID=UPI003D184470